MLALARLLHGGKRNSARRASQSFEACRFTTKIAYIRIGEIARTTGLKSRVVNNGFVAPLLTEGL